MSELDEPCTFCAKFGTRATHAEWFDEELVADGMCVAIPGLGPPAAGYALVLPRLHYRSSADMPQDEFLHLRDLVDKTSRLLGEYFGEVIEFEHGPSATGRGGGCIDHAHVHLVSTEFDVGQVATREYELEPLSNVESLRLLAGMEYLFIRDQSGKCFAARAASVPAQYLRRVIFEMAGFPDEWDYVIYPRPDLVRETIRVFGGAPK